MNNIESQINCFKKGTQYLKLIKPARIGDGILKLSSKELDRYVTIFDTYSVNKQICKFVPASGAASRMFKDLYTFLDNSEVTSYITEFISNIKSFAFYEDLKAELNIQDYDIDDLIEKFDYHIIIRCLLNSEGLSYGSLPKGLLAFHNTKDSFETPIDVHIQEAKAYAGKNPELVFTVSEGFQKPFENTVCKSIIKANLNNAKYAITFQKSETDTIAVSLDFVPITNEKGNYVFRPGGHGALIANLNEIDSDLVFIKNIDNVATETYLQTTVFYKKVLAGVLLEKQQKIAEILEEISSGNVLDADVYESIKLFINKELGIDLKDTSDYNHREISEYFRSILDRPIRVCGMVKNEGEPGGGPFWVQDNNGNVSLQIVESSQVDVKDANQNQILESSTHFNSVDLVCGLKNYKGFKYDLDQFIDNDTYFIAEKSYNGKPILALERPGLWNGSMAHWITLFVEVPLETFNPVKKVNDLLKQTHQLNV